MANRKQRIERDNDICTYFQAEFKKGKKGKCEIYDECAGFYLVSVTHIRTLLKERGII